MKKNNVLNAIRLHCNNYILRKSESYEDMAPAYDLIIDLLASHVINENQYKIIEFMLKKRVYISEKDIKEIGAMQCPAQR